jgi:hypothetical protein
MFSRAGIGGLANTKVPSLPPELWKVIVELETALPKPPQGKLTILDLRSPDRSPVIVNAPNNQIASNDNGKPD